MMIVMKRYILLLGLLLAFFVPAWAQGDTSDADVVLNNNLPTGFNYQALIYANGKPVAEKDIKLRVTLQDDNTPYLVEEHQAKTTKTGWVEVLVGSKKPAEMENVPWEKSLLVKVEVDLGSGSYIALGRPVKMEPVPYALFARTAPIIKGNGDKEAPIFQVRNSRDLPIFSVYEDAVTMNVTERPAGTRRPRGGFAVKSFRSTESGHESTTRLSMDEGALSIFVDPVVRRPRGGFAVKTFKSSMRGDEEVETLFSMDERSTYFTLDQCQVGSTFQFRDRDEESKIIMNLKDGYIQTVSGKDKSTVLEKLPSSQSNTLFFSWVLPGEIPSPTAPIAFEFTNLMRWRTPVVKTGGKEVPYQISIVNNSTNTQGKNLSDYFTVGKIMKCTKDGSSYKMQEAEALMLKSDVKLVAGEKFPDGEIVISWAEYPNVVGRYQINPTQELLARADALVIGASTELIEYTAKSFVAELSALQITSNVYWPEVAHNMPFKLEVTDSNFEDYIKVVNREGDKIYFRLSDNEDFYNYVVANGTLTAADAYSIQVGMKATFPNGVYEETNFMLDMQIKKK